MAVPKPGFTLAGQEGLRCWIKQGSSGQHSRHYTCGICAGWTHTEADATPDVAIVRPSTLDDSAWVRPVGQIFTRSAKPWALMAVQFSYEAEFKDPSALAQAFALGGFGG